MPDLALSDDTLQVAGGVTDGSALLDRKAADCTDGLLDAVGDIQRTTCLNLANRGNDTLGGDFING